MSPPPVGGESWIVAPPMLPRRSRVTLPRCRGGHGRGQWSCTTACRGHGARSRLRRPERTGAPAPAGRAPAPRHEPLQQGGWRPRSLVDQASRRVPWLPAARRGYAVCGRCGASGLGVCAFSVFLNPTPGRWVSVGVDELSKRGGWYTVRRRGRTLLVITEPCDGGGTRNCATLYRASGAAQWGRTAHRGRPIG
jgi:hypothetical protein